MKLTRFVVALLPSVLGLAAVLAVPLAAADAPKPAAVPSPAELVAAAPAADWVLIAPQDLLVMDLVPDSKGRARRVVIQLLPPPFSQGWVGNIRTLARAHWWDGLSVYRVQDNYVAQWGDADGEDKAKARALPSGLAVVSEREYVTPREPGKMGFDSNGYGDQLPSSPFLMMEEKESDYLSTGFHAGWALARTGSDDSMWPIHCYAMVGVARDLSPDTGTGAELYAVIGHAPRQLDRNIALIGRVIAGIEHLSALPRGSEAAGVFGKEDERVPIRSVRLGNELPEGETGYQFLSTESASFAAYADARANRRDPFFIHPAGGADICNIPVPVRRVKAGG
jgi:peptidylprolyl isomerase